MPTHRVCTRLPVKVTQEQYKCHAGGQEGNACCLITTEDTGYRLRADASLRGNENTLLHIWGNQSGHDGSKDSSETLNQQLPIKQGPGLGGQDRRSVDAPAG